MVARLFRGAVEIDRETEILPDLSSDPPSIEAGQSVIAEFSTLRLPDIIEQGDTFSIQFTVDPTFLTSGHIVHETDETDGIILLPLMCPQILDPSIWLSIRIVLREILVPLGD